MGAGENYLLFQPKRAQTYGARGIRVTSLNGFFFFLLPLLLRQRWCGFGDEATLLGQRERGQIAAFAVVGVLIF
jgi:hypothetical protein